MRILAVDDDPVILDLLPVIFRQADLPQLTLAPSGSAALEMLADPDLAFDCLLLDIMMEEMDGISLCARIRQLPRYRHTPILMLTAVKDHAGIEAAFAAGANDYITKPFDVKEIVTRVRVAQRMTEATAHVPRLNQWEIDPTAQPGEHRFDLADPVMLDQTSRLVLPFALGNYLSQLSRSRLDTCVIFALRVDQMDRLFRNARSHEFARAIDAIVQAVGEAIDCPKLLMSYEGDGTFLCIQQGTEPPAWPEIEEQLQEILDRAAPSHDDGTEMALQVSVGNPITPNASRNQRVKKTFDRAIDRATMRERSKEKGAMVRIDKRSPRRRPMRPM
jgi:DNA-binding response OmpR family regulator